MKEVHVECKPDEALIKKLGFNKNKITHHQGKSRVFSKLREPKNHLAVVDEDPGSIKTTYEQDLIFKKELHGIAFYLDNSGNKIFILKVKLEDWILNLCKQSKISIQNYGLPNDPNELHDVINQRIPAFEKLIDILLNENNEGIHQLKNWLN